MTTFRNSVGDISPPTYQKWLEYDANLKTYSIEYTQGKMSLEFWVIVIVMYTIWILNLIMSLIILLNFLIAIISQSFEKVMG